MTLTVAAAVGRTSRGFRGRRLRRRRHYRGPRDEREQSADICMNSGVIANHRDSALVPPPYQFNFFLL